MSRRLYRFLLASGVVFAVSLVLALLDGTGLLVLPQPVRPFIPIALVLSTLVGIVILSGSIGMPTRPPAPGEIADEAPDADAPEASGARGPAAR